MTRHSLGYRRWSLLRRKWDFYALYSPTLSLCWSAFAHISSFSTQTPMFSSILRWRNKFGANNFHNSRAALKMNNVLLVRSCCFEVSTSSALHSALQQKPFIGFRWNLHWVRNVLRVWTFCYGCEVTKSYAETMIRLMLLLLKVSTHQTLEIVSHKSQKFSFIFQGRYY